MKKTRYRASSLGLRGYAASVSNRIANGFNLHAAVVIPGNDRQRLETLLRYTARPPFATERLEQLPDGRLSYRFKTPWRNGTTHAVFTPLEFIEKLCALIPTPRAHMVRFSGVLGPAAKWRSSIVPPVAAASEAPAAAVSSTLTTEPQPPESYPENDGNSVVEEPGKKKRSRKNYSWAQLIQRVFAQDVTTCGKCGGSLRLISPIHPPVATRKILDHLGLPSRPPPLTPAAHDADINLSFDYA